ncbi:uncharacterized protein K489DRAFT_376718 [Dissoconium aciculare CBS 342.82]|uniref:Uncharacterized protein n=1 Tax=Dissoconium aciculare CBS 342.82 TaxID=1314786 RepID=A0A6J3ME77_9PEZI|nr:uncharacterized protein K489DRAFT_376718 [Dissoconium aciculare CBS 342.82]KAF1826316.1 hypothetical protein K489DRAFT_376718 [Dissoconium aciculare CBS 342.82]
MRHLRKTRTPAGHPCFIACEQSGFSAYLFSPVVVHTHGSPSRSRVPPSDAWPFLLSSTFSVCVLIAGRPVWAAEETAFCAFAVERATERFEEEQPVLEKWSSLPAALLCALRFRMRFDLFGSNAGSELQGKGFGDRGESAPTSFEAGVHVFFPGRKDIDGVLHI